MAGSNLGPILLLGGAGVLAWYLFSNSSTTAQASATPATGTGPTPPPPVPYNTPDQIYQRLVANLSANAPAFKANPSSAMLTPYQFKYFLDQVTSVPSGLDFSQMFPQQVKADGSPTSTPTLTLGQFWTAMAPWLSKNVPGMSGFIGLSGLIARAGRY